MANIPIESANLHVPELVELVTVLDAGLRKNFANVSVKVVDCPNLTKSPFHLAGEGLSGTTSLADVGGPPYLLPLARVDKPQYSFTQLFEQVGLHEKGFIMGAGAGPHHDLGVNCEMMANIAKIDNGVANCTHVCKMVDSGYQLMKIDSTNFALLGNFFCCEGKAGKVLEIVASNRTGKDNYMTSIRKCLAEHYGEKPVGLGGVFLVETGTVKTHVMPKFSTTPLYSDDDLNKWLKFYEMPSPLICVGELISHDPGLDLRVEHFHCFSDHNDGGHYHYDVTPAEVSYRGYLNVAETIYRVDRPQVTHNVGRD